MVRPISTGQSMLVTLVVALGIAVAWCAAALWCKVTVDRFRFLATGYESPNVRVDGEPFIARFNGATFDITTLEGEPAAVDQQLLLHPQYVYPPDYGLSRQLDWQVRLTSANDGGAPPSYWYLVHDGRINGRAYGVGYHSLTQRIIGYFGRNGFSDRMPARSEWFEVPGMLGLGSATGVVNNVKPLYSAAHHLTIVASGKLWFIDLAKRTVEAVADCEGPATVSQAWKLLDTVPAAPALSQISATSWIEQPLLVRQHEQITLVDPKGGESRTVPLPESLRTVPFGVFVLPENGLLLVTTELPLNSGEPADQALVWLDPQGTIIDRKPLRLLTRSVSSTDDVASTSIIAVPLLAATVSLTVGMAAAMLNRGGADSLSDALGKATEAMWPALVVVAVIGFVLAVAAYRRQRRYALPHAGWWALFNFLFGLPGWLAYRFHRTWPPVAACPSCQQPSPRDRVACSECGASFPLPARNGTEVYA